MRKSTPTGTKTQGKNALANEQQAFLLEMEKAIGEPLFVFDKELTFGYTRGEIDKLKKRVNESEVLARGRPVIQIFNHHRIIVFDFECPRTHTEADKVEIHKRVGDFLVFLNGKGVPFQLCDSGRGYHVFVLVMVDSPEENRAVFEKLIEESGLALKTDLNYFWLNGKVAVERGMEKKHRIRVKGSKHNELNFYEKEVLTGNGFPKLWLPPTEWLEKKEQEKVEPVTVIEKKIRWREILASPNASFSQRTSAVQQMRSQGIEKKEILALIEKENKWGKYSREKTEKFVDGIFENLSVIKAKRLPSVKVDAKSFKGVKTFRKASLITVSKKIFDYVQQRNINGVERFTEKYSIYRLAVGTGNEPHFLVVLPTEKVDTGEQKLYLKPLEVKENALEFFSSLVPKHSVLIEMCKGLGIETTTGKGRDKEVLPPSVLLDLLTEKHKEKTCLYRLTYGCPPEELRKLSNKLLREILQDYLTQGYEIDSRLEKSFLIDFVNHNNKMIEPTDVMKYNPHSVFATLTKTGKSTLAKRTGKVFEGSNSTVANLLGFSTADKVIEGSLNDLTLTATFDEIPEGQKESALRELLTLLEIGETPVSKGSQRQMPRMYGAFRFMGNPYPKEEEEADGQKDLTDYSFEEIEPIFVESFLRKITPNFEAFGSRIAVFLSNPDIEKARMKTVYSGETVEKLTALASTIRELSRNSYSKLYSDKAVVTWLNKSFPKDYLDVLSKIQKNIKLPSLKQFVKGHRDAYRHLRGASLTLACVHHLRELINGTARSKTLLKEAERRLKELTALNVQSFKALAGDLDKELLKAHYSGLIENEPLHIRVLLQAVAEWNKVHKETNPKLLTDGELLSFIKGTELYKENKLSVKGIWGRLKADLNRTNRALSTYFCEITQTDKVVMVNVKGWEAIAILPT